MTQLDESIEDLRAECDLMGDWGGTPWGDHILRLCDRIEVAERGWGEERAEAQRLRLLLEAAESREALLIEERN